MKNKITLLIICLLLLATQQGKAQSRADKALADVATRKAERERQLTQVRSKVAEQKGQLQFERKVERTPVAQNGIGNGVTGNGAARTVDSTAVFNRSGRKN
jgi:hypothetical protein